MYLSSTCVQTVATVANGSKGRRLSWRNGLVIENKNPSPFSMRTTELGEGDCFLYPEGLRPRFVTVRPSSGSIIALLSDPNPYPSNNKNGNNIIHKTTRGAGWKRKR